MSTLEVKELSHPTGEVLKIASGKTLDLKSQGSVTMPTGSVLQVVTSLFNTNTASSSSSYVSSGHSVTITPKSSSSKIALSLIAFDKSGEIPHLEARITFNPSILPCSVNPTSYL